MKIKIGTRKSNLALIQTNIIKNLIEKNTNHKCEIVEMSTLGDDRRDLKLTDFGGKGAFVDTIEKALQFIVPRIYRFSLNRDWKLVQ